MVSDAVVLMVALGVTLAVDVFATVAGRDAFGSHGAVTSYTPLTETVISAPVSIVAAMATVIVPEIADAACAHQTSCVLSTAG
jgi:hypothetical protein